VKVKCPKCGEEFRLPATFPNPSGYPSDSLAELVWEYLDLFRPRRKSMPPSGKKRARLQEEVRNLIKCGAFLFYGRPYQVSREEIKAALREVCNREPVGLVNHNYLKKVMISMVEKDSHPHPLPPPSRGRAGERGRYAEDPDPGQLRLQRTRDGSARMEGPTQLGELNTIKNAKEGQ